jgi:hypothetical protein
MLLSRIEFIFKEGGKLLDIYFGSRAIPHILDRLMYDAMAQHFLLPVVIEST